MPIELCDPNARAFNVSFRIKFKDGGSVTSVIIRFPKPGATLFPDEKVRNEVDILRSISEEKGFKASYLYMATGLHMSLIDFLSTMPP